MWFDWGYETTGRPFVNWYLDAAHIGDLTVRGIEILNTRKGNIENVSAVATVISVDNSPKDFFNQAKLENFSETDLEIFTIDKNPEGTPSALIENLNAKG